MKLFDKKRTARFFLLGATFIAPFLHYTYTYLLPYIASGSSTQGIMALKKIAFDQIVLSPIFFTLFYHTLNLIEGKSFKEGNE